MQAICFHSVRTELTTYLQALLLRREVTRDETSRTVTEHTMITYYCRQTHGVIGITLAIWRQKSYDPTPPLMDSTMQDKSV